MLTSNRHYPHLSYEVMTDLAHIVENQLADDWVIRIEYSERIEYLSPGWQQWGNTFYKYKNSSGVMDTIFSCHVNNPLCAIRLHAEKYNPISNLFYSVCKACNYSEETREVLQEQI